MEKDLLEKLKKLSSLTQSELGENENNVKHKFIVPFLECFGYNDLAFEHSAQGSRIDIFIDNISTHKIVIEAKAYNKNLDDFILKQLKDYCDIKRPILAIIANGEEIRFYSPFWRIPEFSETLLYVFNRGNLKDEDIITKIEKILSKENLQNGKIDDFIREREDEIKKAKNEIKSVQTNHKVKISAIENEINELNEDIKKLQENVNCKQQEILDLKNSSDTEIKNLENQYLYTVKTNKTVATVNIKSDIVRNDNEKVSSTFYLPRYSQQINNQGTMANTMLNYIKERNCVTWEEVVMEMTEKQGYKKSGSIDACYRALISSGLIRLEGKKGKGKIYYVKDNNEK